jgi:hypothetical protein
MSIVRMSRADASAKIAGFLFSAHRLGECVLTWVAEVAKNLLHASHKAETALASAAFRYIRLTRVAYGGNLRQPGLARFRKFREVFFDAGAEATLAGLNSGTLRFDIGCTCSRPPALLRHRDGCGKQHRSADYYEALHHLAHLLDKPSGREMFAIAALPRNGLTSIFEDKPGRRSAAKLLARDDTARSQRWPGDQRRRRLCLLSTRAGCALSTVREI